jgi:hypothetical protein
MFKTLVGHCALFLFLLFCSAVYFGYSVLFWFFVLIFCVVSRFPLLLGFPVFLLDFLCC